MQICIDEKKARKADATADDLQQTCGTVKVEFSYEQAESITRTFVGELE